MIAPTNIRIVPVTANWSFDQLAARPDCVSAIRMGSQAEIDAYPPPGKPYDPVTQKKRPVVYDPAVNAARGDIHFIESNDIQQKYWSLSMPPGDSAFIMWDMRYNEAFRYQGLGYIIRHKAFQLNGQNQVPWWTIRSFYEPVPDPFVAEMVITSNSQNYVFPGLSWRGDRETLEPRLPNSELFLNPLEWGRIAFYFKDLGPTTPYTNVFYPNGNSVAQQWPEGRVMEMSSWMASESRAPFQVHNRIKVVQPYASGLKLSKFEVDGVTPHADGTHDYSDNPGFGYIWQRNFIQLLNPTDDVSLLVQRPVA
jgi:hypothetical protein